MGAFFVYMFKSSVCLAVFYLFYKGLLSRETFHRFNRFALLGLLVLSLLIPSYRIYTEQPVEFRQTVTEWEKLFIADIPPLPSAQMEIMISEAPSDTVWTWQKGVLAIYIAGILFFFLRHIYSLIRLILLLKRSKMYKLENNIRLLVHEYDMAPFSWMKYIVVSVNDLKEGKDEILIHEREHIRLYHFLDLLIAEIAIIFQWFNPAAWLLKRELQTIHEYEADEAVINQGIDAKQYQLLLIKKAVGTVRFNSLANSFNHSKLKKRITMMLKRKSNPWAKLRYLYVLPLAAIAVAAFARSEISDELNQISALKVSDLTPDLENNPVKLQPITVKQYETIKNRTDSVTVMGGGKITFLPFNQVFIPGKIYKINIDGRYVLNEEVEKMNFDDVIGITLFDEKVLAELYDAKDGMLSFSTKYYKAIDEKAVNDLEFPQNKKYRRVKSFVFNGNYDTEGGVNKPLSDFLSEDHLRLSDVKIILDGEKISEKDLKGLQITMLSDITLASDKKNEENVLFIRSRRGDSFRQFKAHHDNPLVILNGKEVSIDQIKSSDYWSTNTYESYGSDESFQFGPKAKDGALFIGVMSYHYRTDAWKEKMGKYIIYSRSNFYGSIPPDSLDKVLGEKN